MIKGQNEDFILYASCFVTDSLLYLSETQTGDYSSVILPSMGMVLNNALSLHYLCEGADRYDEGHVPLL